MRTDTWRYRLFDIGYGMGAGIFAVVGMFILVGLWRPLLEPWPTPVRVRGLLVALATSAFLAGMLAGRCTSERRRTVFAVASGTILTLLLAIRATLPPKNAATLVVYQAPGILLAMVSLAAGTIVMGWARRWLTAERLALVSALIVAIIWGLLWFLHGGLFKSWLWNLLPTIFPFVGGIVLLGVWRAPVAHSRHVPTIRLLATVPSLLLIAPLAWTYGVGRIAYPASIEAMQPHAWVRLPANEPLTVVWGGNRIAANYHAFSPDQRWAYDLVVAPAFVGHEDPREYGCWSVPVVAPADGRVVVAHDGEPDHPAGQLPQIHEVRNEIVFGNHVVLEVAETGTYLVVAHLQAGSVRVRVGETVREGEPIAACGNSGYSSEPHIHIHHQRQPPSERPVGFAEGLPLFFRDHDGPPMPHGGVEQVNGRWATLGPTIRHIGRAP